MSTDWSEGTAVRSEAEPERSESPPESDPERSESPPESDPERSESPPESDPERLRRRLRRRTDEIERCEVEEALSALDARGDLTEEQRETVRELGSALVEELTAPPERGLRQAARAERTGAQEGEQKRTRAIRRLFDIGEA